MFIAFSAFLLGQAASQPQILNLPMGMNSAVHKAYLSVEDAVASGDYDEAKRREAFLPKRSFVVSWDPSNVPGAMKDDAERFRDLALQAWTTRVFNLQGSVGTDADIAFRFVDHCANDARGQAAASTLTFGVHPRLSVAIGLKRGKELEPIAPVDVFVEVAHGIGAYLGLADDPLPGSCMYRDDNATRRPLGPSQANFGLATAVLTMTDQLRRDIDGRKAVAATAPSISVTPTVFGVGNVQRGTRVPLIFRITNKGTGLLTYNLVPDCGCFSAVPPGGVAPGETATVKSILNTTEYAGPEHKEVVLYSNDPDNPAIEIPVDFKALPSFRFYRPEGDTIIVPKNGISTDVLLTLPKGSKIVPGSYQATGYSAVKLTMAPWQGAAADPDMDEPVLPRQGYKLHLEIPGKDLPSGRTPLNLQITTQDPDFPILQCDLFLQRGVIAEPETVFLGNMPGVAKGSFRVSRHGKPFTILKVDTGNPNLTAVVRPIHGQVEYQVDLVYDGQAPKGDFLSVVKVRVNDPTEPPIEVQVAGTVR